MGSTSSFFPPGSLHAARLFQGVPVETCLAHAASVQALLLLRRDSAIGFSHSSSWHQAAEMVKVGSMTPKKGRIDSMNEVCPWCGACHHYSIEQVDSVVHCGSCTREFLPSKRRRDQGSQPRLPAPRELRPIWESLFAWLGYSVWFITQCLLLRGCS
jgi:hypothetical protein